VSCLFERIRAMRDNNAIDLAAIGQRLNPMSQGGPDRVIYGLAAHIGHLFHTELYRRRDIRQSRQDTLDRQTTGLIPQAISRCARNRPPSTQYADTWKAAIRHR